MTLPRTLPSVQRALGAGLALAAVLVPTRASAAEPTKVQCIAANESAQDLRGSGKLIEARAQLALCVAESCPGVVRQDCAQRLADVDKALPTLVLVAKDASGNDLGGVHATVDGKPMPGALNGTAVPVDPGEHRLVLQAQGLPDAEKTLVIHEGEKERREVITFAGSTSPGEATTETASTPPPAAPAELPSPGARPGDLQREIGLAAGGVGLVGLVLGTIFGIVAKSTYDHATGSGECSNGGTVCNSQGYSDVQSAYGQATVSTVAVVTGAILAGGGAALYLTAPRAGVSVGPSASTTGGGLTLRGSW